MKTTMILAMASLLASAPAAAQVTAISGMVKYESEVKYNNVVTTGTPGFSSWAILQPGTTFTASSSALAYDNANIQGNPVLRRSAFGNASATWLSASQGTANFHWGRSSTQDNGFGYMTTGPNGSDAPNWSYSFTLAAPATFTFSYQRTLNVISGTKFGSGGHYLSLGTGYCCDYNAGWRLDGDVPFDFGGATITLGAGAHTLTLNNLHWISGGSTMELEAMTSFNWAIDPVTGGVPEPASWAMLIAGFGLVGTAMRRRAALPRAVAA